MENSFFSNIRNIKNAIDTNRLVVFAGAGISRDSGIPTWGEMISEMKKDLDLPKDENDYFRIAQIYYNNRQLKEYIDKVRLLLKHKKVKSNQIHDALFDLKPEHILTTNYDDLLDQVIINKSLPFSIVDKDIQFPYALKTQLLVKIHGDLADTTIVLKEDDYLDYSVNHPLIEAFLKSVFATKLVLFVGYGFGDDNLKMILQTVRNILGNNFQNAYFISTEKDMHQSIREYFKSKGINVVNYHDAFLDNENFIDKYLEGKNILQENYNVICKNLSEKGQKLFNFLTFLGSYDYFNESLKAYNIIDQIYFSLDRFSELKSLPPNFITNLYPFKTTKRYVHHLQRTSIKTKNDEINNLFFDLIEIKNNKVILKNELLENLPKDQIEEYKSKIKKIIIYLNFSMIFSLTKENEKPDSLNNYGWSNNIVKLYFDDNKKCECILCKIERFEINGAIQEVYNNPIKDSSFFEMDMQVAYANYKFGNFYLSFNLFMEIASKAWREAKYFTYFICKQNMKYLRNLIDFNDQDLYKLVKKKVIDDIDDINFDKLLDQIPFMGNEQYDLLNTIREDKILRQSENEINRLYDAIVSDYESYERGNVRISAPNYPDGQMIEMYKIYTFYINNCIVIDEFTIFKNIIRKGVKSLLINYATKTGYKSKLKEFEENFFTLAIFYCNPEDLKKIFKNYRIKKLNYNKINTNKIIGITNNYLSSFFRVNNFLGPNTLPNTIVEKQFSGFYFENKVRQYFSNIFLLLSFIDIQEEDSTKLVKNIIGFIKNEKFLLRSDIEIFSTFVREKYLLFDEGSTIELLKNALPKIELYIDGGLISALSTIFIKNGFNGISDRKLIEKILYSTRHQNQSNEVLVDLWLMSNAEFKEEIQLRIVNKLKTNFDAELYSDAVSNKILDFDMFFKEYVLAINSSISLNNYELVDDKPQLNSFVFLNFIYFLYSLNISFSDPRLKKLKGMSDYMRFYIDPENFDYDKFKLEWLYMIDDSNVIYEKLAKISKFKSAFKKGLKGNLDPSLMKNYILYIL